MYGLNASGPAPKSLSVAALKTEDSKDPSYGVEPIDVPGAVAGWMTLHERFGKLPLEEVMALAIRYAEEGYPVTPNISVSGRKLSKTIPNIVIVRNSRAGSIHSLPTTLGSNPARCSAARRWLRH